MIDISKNKEDFTYKINTDSEEDESNIRHVYRKYFTQYAHCGLDIGEWIDFPIFLKILQDIGNKLNIDIIHELNND